MTCAVIVDTNLTVLLIVGSASRDYIRMHRRFQKYTEDDFDVLGELINQFDDIITVPHVLSETSNLIRQVVGQAHRLILARFQVFVETVVELPIASLIGCQRLEFRRLGLADSVLLHVCSLDLAGTRPTLVTVDGVLADTASSLGFSVVDYKREYMSGDAD